MPDKIIIRVDAQKVRRLREDLGRRLGDDVSQDYVSEHSGVSRVLISYMENSKSRRRFSFETVYLLARFYREALSNPVITTDYLAKEMDRLKPIPRLAEDRTAYDIRTQKLEHMRDKLTDLDADQLAELTRYIDFLLTKPKSSDSSA
jgi:transcriptional regulator with XRE-family HTH domain